MRDDSVSGQNGILAGSELSWLIDHAPQDATRKRRRVIVTMLIACLALGVLTALAILHERRTSQAQSLKEQAAREQVLRSMLDAPFAPGSLRKLSPQDAMIWNSQAPVSVEGVTPSAAFLAHGRNVSDAMRSLDCLTAAIYYEAGQESVDGRRAVAQVILNRVRHPAFPATVCGVVFQGAERRTGCQFTFTCDGALARKPSVTGWAQARILAEQALAGSVYGPVGWATHYHADYVVPYWASSLAKIGQVGAHIFYTWKGRGGTAAAFLQRYAGNEPIGMPAATGPSEVPKAVEASQRRPELVLVDDAERPVLIREQKQTGGKAERNHDALVREVSPTDRWVIQSPVTP